MSLANKRISLSITQPIDHKADSKDCRLPYCFGLFSYDYFVEDIIKKGRLFSGYFGTQKMESFKPYKNMTDDKWKGQNYVGIDVEGANVPEFKEAIEKIILKPTVAYTTASNGIKGNRYRFIYIFSEPIVIKEEFEALYWRIIGMLMKSYDFHTKDHCGSQVSRKFQGNPLANIEVFRSDREYSPNEFMAYPSAYTEVKNSKKTSKKASNKPSERTSATKVVTRSNEEFWDDVEHLGDNVEFLQKWGEMYKVRTSNRPMLTYNEIGIADGSTCYEIVRPWVKYTYEGKTFSKIKKFQDGQHRRSIKLPKAAAQYKAIYGDEITLEQLVYCLIFELFHFYNNDEDPITRQDLIKIATWAMGRETTATSSSHKYVIEKEIKNKQAIQGIMRKEEHYKEIDELYDTTLTINENFEKMKAEGYGIGMTTLKNYCFDRGIKFMTKNEIKKQKIKAVWMKSEATTTADLIREIYEDTGIKCNYPTLNKYIAEWEEESEIVEELVQETFADYDDEEEKEEMQLKAAKNLINAISYLKALNLGIVPTKAKNLLLEELTSPHKIRDITIEYR